MKIEAYTLSGCNHCTSLKELFRRANVDYTEIIVTKDVTIEQFKEWYPDVVYFPFVVIDGVKVGTLVETVKLFVEKGLVTSKNKE